MTRLLCFLCIIGIFTGCSTHYRQLPPPFKEEEVYLPPPVRPVKKIIVLDAGHGGKDHGCEPEKLEHSEKELTLKTVLLVKKHLNSLGYQTILTRSQDLFLSLEQRAEIANDVKSCLFVSVHFNSATNTKAKGIEIYYYDSEKNPTRTEQSKKLATAILDKALVCTEASSRGVKTANLAVIRETTMPATLIECGFLTNPEERKKCVDPIYLDALAWGIARGIDDYAKQL